MGKLGSDPQLLWKKATSKSRLPHRENTVWNSSYAAVNQEITTIDTHYPWIIPALGPSTTHGIVQSSREKLQVTCLSGSLVSRGSREVCLVLNILAIREKLSQPLIGSSPRTETQRLGQKGDCLSNGPGSGGRRGWHPYSGYWTCFDWQKKVDSTKGRVWAGC